MLPEFNQAICELKENVLEMYNSIFLNFEPSEKSDWREISGGFNEVVHLINQYSEENLRDPIIEFLNSEIENIYVFINGNNFDNYLRAFDSLRIVLNILTEKCDEFSRFYSNKLSEADNLLQNKEFENAKSLYQEALNLNPNDMYPIKRINEINSALVNQNNYNNLISEADNLFNTKDYENARIKYQESLNLKPDEINPINRINEIDTILNSNTTKEKKYSTPYFSNFSSIFSWSRNSFKF